MKLQPKMFKEAEKTKTPSSLIMQIVIFIGVFVVIYFTESVFTFLITLPEMISVMGKNGLFNADVSAEFGEYYKIASSIMSSWKIVVTTLFCTVFGTIFSMIYCRFIEGRSFNSMGFKKKKAISHYLRGLLTGLIMMSIITGITVFTGVAKIKMLPEISIGIILLYFVGFLIQGMSEEVIFRGYLMNSIGGKHNAAIAVAVSSIAFAIVHLANPGITIIAFINLTLFGIFAGLYVICFDDIWGACAIHSIWNFTQGNVFGISVSGTGSVDSIFRVTAVNKNAFLSGGEFGIEGSIFTTLVLITASIIVFLKIRKNVGVCEK